MYILSHNAAICNSHLDGFELIIMNLAGIMHNAFVTLVQ